MSDRSTLRNPSLTPIAENPEDIILSLTSPEQVGDNSFTTSLQYVGNPIVTEVEPTVLENAAPEKDALEKRVEAILVKKDFLILDDFHPLMRRYTRQNLHKYISEILKSTLKGTNMESNE